MLKEQDVIDVNGYGPVSNAAVYGLRNSIRGAKFPMSVNVDLINFELTNGIKCLAQAERGAGHDQWLTGVVVQFDLKFTNKAWVEAERYHFFDFVSSQSTMHRITKFDLRKSYNKYVDPDIIEIMQRKVNEYNKMVDSGADKKDIAEKYLEILYSNPVGFELTARMTTNYRQLKTIYAQRKTHRLPEWREFCIWVESLPYSELITGDLKD